MHPARQPRGRRALVHTALAGLLATIVFALTQCRMVEDQLVNVEPFRSRGNECIKSCKKTYKEALEAERHLHRDNLRACGVSDNDDDDDVRAGDRAGGQAVATSADVLRERDGGDRDRGDRDGTDSDDDHGAIDDEDDRGDGECSDDLDDTDGGDSACVRAEALRHCAELKRIEEERKQCIANCHNQGGGSGG